MATKKQAYGPAKERVFREQAEIIRRHRGGASVYRLAKDYGVHDWWLTRRLIEWGEHHRRPRNGQGPPTPAQARVIEDRDKVVRRYREGTSVYRLAKDYGVFDVWLTKRLDSWGVPRRGRRAALVLRNTRTKKGT
ncbi:hypothetical protein ACFQ67_27365 [Streptomyces sp. NPDC056488]|uniref:hypothetical protein n=1 Tax=Streptomyces sp. NPDC056488 TaxID=3345836 RepID=UPI003683FD44